MNTNAATKTSEAATAAAVVDMVLALSYQGSKTPSEATLLFHLAKNIAVDVTPARFAGNSIATAAYQTYTESLFPLLFRAIELDYPNLTTALLRMHHPTGFQFDWDMLAAAAVGSQAPRALRAILSHPHFVFKSGSVLWAAWENGDREACKMVLQVGQARDCQLAYVIAYEEESVHIEPMIGLAEARRALAKAKALGQRPLVPVETEKESEGVEENRQQGTGQLSLLDLPDDLLEYWVREGFVGQQALGQLRQACRSLHARLPAQPPRLTRDLYWRLLTHLLTSGPIAPQVDSFMTSNFASVQQQASGDGRMALLQALMTLRSTKPTLAALDYVRDSFTVVVEMDVLLLCIDDHFMQYDPPRSLDAFPELTACFALAYSTIPDDFIPDLVHNRAFLHAVQSLDLTSGFVLGRSINIPKHVGALLIQGNYAHALRFIRRHATQLAAAKLNLIHTLAVALHLGTCPEVVSALMDDMGAWSPMVRMDCIEVSRVLVHAVAAGSVERVRQVMEWFPHQFKVAREMPRENWRKCEAAAVKYADRGGRECFLMLKSDIEGAQQS